METNKKEAIKKAVFISALILLIIIVGFFTIIYEIEGEKNLPFNLTKISIISTADGIQAEDNTIEVWQVNDIYLSFEKNENYNEQELIRRIGIENLQITQNPQIGEVNFYRPSNKETTTYEYEEDYIIKSELNYFGASQTNLKELNIANQGGTIGFRTCIKGIGNLAQTEEEGQIIGLTHDATLLEKAQINKENIKYQIQFDIVIELESDKKYKAEVTLDLPNEELEGQTVKGIEKTDLDDIVFKRMRF